MVLCYWLYAGDVDIVMGGPPCQGISGNNRHAARVNILDDSRYGKQKLAALLAAPKAMMPVICGFE